MATGWDSRGTSPVLYIMCNEPCVRQLHWVPPPPACGATPLSKRVPRYLAALAGHDETRNQHPRGVNRVQTIGTERPLPCTPLWALRCVPLPSRSRCHGKLCESSQVHDGQEMCTRRMVLPSTCLLPASPPANTGEPGSLPQPGCSVRARPGGSGDTEAGLLGRLG